MTPEWSLIILPHLGGPHTTLTVGNWTRNASFLVPQPNIYERRKDLSGVTLINSVLPWEPVMIFDVGRDGIIRNLDGFMYRLYMTLQAASKRDTTMHSSSQ